MLLAAVDDRLAAAAPCCANTENVACANFIPPGSTDDAEQDLIASGPAGFDRWDLLYPLAAEASARAGQRPRLLRDLLAELHHERHRRIPQTSRRLSDVGPRRVPRMVWIATAPRAFLRDANPDLFLVRTLARKATPGP